MASRFIKYKDPYLNEFATAQRAHRKELPQMSLCTYCTLKAECDRRKAILQANKDAGLISIITVCPDFVEKKG